MDLDKQYKSIKKEVLKKIQEVVESKKYIQGPYADRFAEEFSKAQHCLYTVGCSNGTAAISTAMEALNIGPGDEVITTPFTFIATTEAILKVGAKPVFVDVNPDDYTINPSLIEKALTKKTKAILPVHIFGYPSDMGKIRDIAKKHRLKIIEDCAQAHLANIDGNYVGSFSHVGTFSFYPGKNLGAYGDAGAIVTNSKETWLKCRMLIDHGRKEKYLHTILGNNHRMDGLQAAILSVKLKYLERWTKKRRDHAQLYDKLLRHNPAIKIPRVEKGRIHVYHLYVVGVKNRKEVLDYLIRNGVNTAIHYPIPLHLQPSLKFLGYKKGDLNTQKAITALIKEWQREKEKIFLQAKNPIKQHMIYFHLIDKYFVKFMRTLNNNQNHQQIG